MESKRNCVDFELNEDNLHFQVIQKSKENYPKFHKFQNFISVIIKHNLKSDLDIIAMRVNMSRVFKDIFNGLLQDIEDEDFVYIEISNSTMVNPIMVSPIKRRYFDHKQVFDKFFQYVQSFREFFSKNSFDIMVNVTKNVVGSGLKNNISAPRLIDQVSKNKRSIIVIKNNDSSCGLRAFFVSKYHQDNKDKLDKKMWKCIRYNINNIQYTESLKIAEKCGININDPIGPNEWQIIQNQYKDYQIKVIDSTVNLKSKNFIYLGPTNNKYIYIQYTHGHYNAIVNIRGFFETIYFCEKCFKGYSNIARHICEFKCKLCFSICDSDGNEIIKCDKCELKYLGQKCYDNHLPVVCNNVKLCPECDEPIYKQVKHVCGENFFCNRCNIVAPYHSHHCMIKAKNIDKIKKSDAVNKIIVAFDIESIITENKHRANLLVFKTVCDQCYGKNNCTICFQRKEVLFGSDCVQLFVDYLFLQLPKIVKNQSVIYTFAHNCRAYDGQFLLREIFNRKFADVNLIMRGRKILKLEIGNVKILDSLNFFLQPLEKLPKALGLQDTLMKGMFPFLFNEEKNYSYSGNIPDVNFFGYDYMTEEKQVKFNSWYKEFIASGQIWNFKDELIKYCTNDVNILLECIMKFRQEFKRITNIDPITRSFTLASVGFEVFRANYLLENQLAKSPHNTYSFQFNNNSHKGNAWIDYLKKFHGLDLLREYKIYKKYADGYDRNNKAVYEFYECFWHGHNCSEKYFDQKKFNDTIERKTFLESKGYKVNEFWECEYNLLKKDQNYKNYLKEREKYYYNMKNNIGWLDIRDSFFGGRTDNERYYYEVKSDEKIRIVDFCSEYPYVLKNCDFPVGVPQSIKENFDFTLKNYFGFIKCKILPPKSLRIPVLPYKIVQFEKLNENGKVTEKKLGEKLLFPLCQNCATYKKRFCDCADRSILGTWTTVEVKKALELGYELLEIYEVLNYDEQARSSSIFKKYINQWLKIKQEASGWPSWCHSEEDKLKYIHDYEKIEGIKLEYEKICKNDALRFIAKIMLNSFWGKLAQKPNQSKQSLFHTYLQYWNLLNDDQKIVESEVMLNDETLMASWKYVNNELDTHTEFNVAVASYVTAWARLNLYDVLLERDRIRPHSILYYDTDSVYFIEKECDPKIKIGSLLGDLTDEVTDKYGEGAKCIKFVSLGAKNYAYVIEKSNGEIKTEYKCKGISLTGKTKDIVNFKNIVNMAIKKQENNESVPLMVPQIRWKIDKFANVYTEHFNKAYKATGDKRNVLFKNDEYVTVPWGYQNP